jgi:hypothetical protein
MIEGFEDDCSIYFIESGKVEIFIDTTLINQKTKRSFHSLKVLESGESFGATSFFTGQVREFSIRSLDFCKFLIIKR